MIRQPPSSIRITAKDVDTLDELKRHLEERANAQAEASQKESERDYFLQRMPSDQRPPTMTASSNADSNATPAAGSSSNFLLKRRRLANEAGSANQRRVATLERTGNATAEPSMRRPRQP